MADTQSMVKDLISTVEEKVNKPLAQSTGALTGEFYSDPGSTRQRIVSENASNPLNPLQIDALVGQRRGSIASQIAGNNSLASSNSGLLNNYFDLINSQAQRASDAAYKNAQLSQSANKKDYDLIQLIDGYHTYDKTTGQVGPLVGQGPKGPLSASEQKAQEAQQLNQVYSQLRDDISKGQTDIRKLSVAYPELDVKQIQAEIDALKKKKSIGGFLTNKETYGGIGAGAALGAGAGLLGGPFAPLTVPAGAIAGGIGGLLGAGATYLGDVYH